MTRVKIVLVAAMTIPLAGCLLSGKPKTAAYVPPPPKPAPASPPESLSIPQTRVDLPPRQDVPQEALHTAPAEDPPTPVPPKPASPPAKTHVPAAPKPPSPSEPPPPDPEIAPQRPPIQEILPVDEQKRLEASVQKHKAEIVSLKAQAQQGHRLTANQKSMLVKIDQFVAQCDQAESTGDMRSADEFAEKANILAKELQSGK